MHGRTAHSWHSKVLNTSRIPIFKSAPWSLECWLKCKIRKDFNAFNPDIMVSILCSPLVAYEIWIFPPSHQSTTNFFLLLWCCQRHNNKRPLQHIVWHTKTYFKSQPLHANHSLCFKLKSSIRKLQIKKLPGSWVRAEAAVISIKCVLNALTQHDSNWKD